MDSIRKWFYRPKKEDKSLLAQFFYADESLNGVACELDSFDGRQEPERCTSLVNQLRHCQDKVLSICNQIMDELIPEARANRDFRVKFPDDVMQENLAGQLWFGAECLAAGSSILNREAESSAMRPLAKALTKSLETVRNLLREQALRGQTNLKAQNPLEPATEKLIESLKIFDRLFADFELCYVGAMVPVKSTKEYEQQELVCVLFSETLQRALERGLLSQADVDNYEPALMFTIPRLAIVAGLLAPPGGPLCLDSASLDSISEMFRPFRSLLLKIRELLWTLNNRELYMLEKLLCSMEDAAPAGRPQPDQTQQSGQSQQEQQLPDLDEFVHNFYTGYPNCKDFIADFYTVTRNNGSNMDEVANDAVLILEQQAEPTNEHHRRRSPTRAEHGQSPQAGLSGTQRHDSSGSSDFYSCDSVSVEITENQLSQTESSASDPLQTDADSSKLISEANKSLSNLLLEADCQNETSEHTDSGICTVISSENTSLYDKSPEEKKSFAHELEQNDNEDSNEPNKNDEPDEIELDEEAGKGDEEEEENTSYSCSNVLNSPKRRDSNKSDNSCVCSSRTSRSSSTYLTNSLEPSKQTPHMSPHLHGSNEEIIGIALGSGQIPVCDGNQPSFQINYTENWENLNINIEASTSRREFWNDLKCESGSSSAQTGKNEKTLVLSQQQQHHHHHSQQDKLSSKKRKEEKQKRRHHRRMLVYNAGDNSRRRVAYQASLQLPTSTESSRSNSTDRCLNPRLVNFGSSLHPSQNTRQMPNFGARSPHASPRMQHFESKSSSKSRRHGVTAPRHQNHQYHQHHQQQQHQHHQQHQQIVTLTNSSQSRKLLEHRRQRSGEHMQRVKKKDSSRRERGSHKLDNYKKKSGKFAAESDLINDGLGPRTNKSGIVTSEHRASDTSASMEPERQAAQNKQQMFDASTCIRTDLTSSSSCSSCYDSSSETSEFQSDCQDDEEIALAMQAAEIANRNQIRAKFRSSEDLVHRLFVCIAGVADQLQTNFASDLRNILKCVFLMNSSQSIAEDEKIDEPSSNTAIETSAPNSNDDTHEQHLQEPQQLPHSTSNETIVEDEPTESRNCSMTERGEECVERAPVWVPDSVAPRCMACQAGFTVVRRRHHCRNCGKVFCGRCSSNNVPLPRYGHTKPVRVCNRCFIYQVTPFTVSQVTPTS